MPREVTNKSRKILVLSHMYPTKSNPVYGLFVHDQIKELQRQGCEIRVIKPVPLAPFPLPYMSRKWWEYAETETEALLDGVQVYYPRYLLLPRDILFDFSGFLVYRGIRKLVARLSSQFKFDIIHAHVALPAGYAGLVLKKSYRNCKLVVTIHGQDLLLTVNRFLGFKFIKRVFAAADRIITVSSRLKRETEQRLGFEEKTIVISNGISPEKIERAKEDSSNLGRCVESAGDLVISVSNLIASKGIDLNIKAIAKLADSYPSLSYLVVGEGPEKQKLEKLVAKLNLGERIVFTGQLPHGEALKKVAGADVFSLPSWKEGFGVVYLEAMACGKPVIACRGEGIEDVIEDGVNGILVEPKDIDDLAKKIELLLDDKKKAEQIGQAGRKLVLERYTWAENARKTITLYKEVLGDG